nr:MAG TPA: hypothetical protein [Caudoviricetes sp.]
MKGYKAFNKGLICKGKKYKENETFEEERAVPCHRGMHFCKNPFDVLNFYDLVDENGEFSDFARVEAPDDAEVKTDDNIKYCTTKLKIGAKFSFAGFVKTCVDFAIEKTQSEKPDSGDYAKIGSSGNSAKIGSSGDSAKIKSTGYDSIICCAGDDSCVSAKKGSWITLAEWKYSYEKDRYVPKCVKTEYVDGERIKEDTMYKLIDGEFTEV